MAFATHSFTLEREERHDRYEGRSVWHGAAFVIEAMLLLLFLVVSLVVFMSLFGNANEMGRENDRLSNAVTLATNKAEQFSSDPAHSEGFSQADDYLVACTVTPETTASGTIYNATITVSADNETIYTLETSAYVSGGGGQ